MEEDLMVNYVLVVVVELFICIYVCQVELVNGLDVCAYLSNDQNLSNHSN